MARYITEFIGTFFLVLTIGLCSIYVGAIMPLLTPLAVGSILMVMVYMGGHVSGAHYNPAVTLALFINGDMKSSDLIPYWVAQLGGAIVAAMAVSLSGPVASPELIESGLASPGLSLRYFGPAPADGYSLLTPGVWMAEVLFTFALMLVIFNVAVSRATKGNSYYGLAIGFTVAAGAFVVGGISGAVFNPAVGTGPNLVMATLGGSPEALVNIILYIVAPIAGALLAIPVFRLQESTVTEQQEASE
ncbi:MAG: MIP/aquaporin family protein [Pirellulaceae bacterium]